MLRSSDGNMLHFLQYFLRGGPVRIGVIGGGAIGLLICSYLSEQHEVTLYINRQEQAGLIEAENIERYQADSFDARSTVRVKQMTELEAEACFIVCVKQAGMEHVLSILKKVAPRIPTIFTQNGMGHHLYLKDLHHPSYLGIIEHGAVKMSDHQVNHLGSGQIKIAAATGSDDEAISLVRDLTEINFPFLYVDDAIQLVKNKLIVNAVINPLTAIFNVQNGEIIRNKFIHRLAKKLCVEAAEVLDLPFEESWNRIEAIAEVTGGNTSSMLADIQQHRQTEIEAISGYLLHMTTIEIPYTQFVYEAIQALEAR